MKPPQVFSIVLTVLAGALASALKLQLVPSTGQSHQLAEWCLAVIAIVGTALLPGIFKPSPAEGNSNTLRGSVSISLLPWIAAVVLGFLAIGCVSKYCADPAYPAHKLEKVCLLQGEAVACDKIAGIGAENAAPDVLAILIANGPNYIGDLVGLAGKLGPLGASLVACLSAAIEAYFEAPSAPPVSPGPKMLALRAPLTLPQVERVISRAHAAAAYFSSGSPLTGIPAVVLP